MNMEAAAADHPLPPPVVVGCSRVSPDDDCDKQLYMMRARAMQQTRTTRKTLFKRAMVREAGEGTGSR